MMLELLQALGIKSAATSIAGLAGGLLSLRFFDGLNAAGKVFTVAGGWACANYGTPVLIEFYKLQSDGYHAGIAFAIGLFGMSIMAAVFQVIRGIDWTERAKTLLDKIPGLGGNKGGNP